MACDICYRRKVRCDLDNGPPCVACVTSHSECTFVIAEQHKSRRRARKPRQVRRSTGVQGRSNTPNRNSENSALYDYDNQVKHNATGLSLFNTRDALVQPTVPTEADIVEETLAKTALTRFYHHSINKTNWMVFREKGYTRIAYIGTPVSNLAKLVEDEGHFSGSAYPSLHLPFPPIRPTIPWRPPETLPLVKWYSTCFPEDTSALPAKDIRDDLVESFFEKVHPGFPVVDESEFRRHYSDADNPPPLLLLQAVLLVGAHVSTHPKIIQSRALVKVVIFRRAKALFDLHYENDRMHVVQAALLFIWHSEGADNVASSVYYWVGIACRVAFGLGMHRDLSASATSRMPADDRKIYRRIWWTLYQIEILASIHHGRPCMIDPDEFDQLPLTQEDFIEQNGTLNVNVEVDYCIHNASLCTILLSIIKLSTPGAAQRFIVDPQSFYRAQDNINERLASWYLRLPSDLASPNSSPTNFWSLQLHMHYNMALLHLHRLHRPPSDLSTITQQRNSTEICQTAASSISKIFDDMLSIKLIDRCWFTALTSLLAATIQISYEARSAARNGATVLAIQAQARLERMLPVISAISPYWSSAVAILNLYRDLLKQYRKQTQSSFDFQTPADAAQDIVSFLRSPPRRIAHFEDCDSLGSVGVLGNDWQALFGAGQVESFPELEFEGMDDWLTMPANPFASSTDL